jgi:hypothetical protein
MNQKPRTVFEWTAKFARIGDQSNAIEDFEPQPCDRATDAPPGSAQRIAEYKRRIELGMELHHEDDERWEFAVPTGRDTKPMYYTPFSYMRTTSKFKRARGRPRNDR